jgi:hypothetical protein
VRIKDRFVAAVPRCSQRSINSRTTIRFSVLAALIGCCLVPSAARASGAAQITLTPPTSTLVADGQSHFDAQVNAVDGSNAPVAGDVITFTPSGTAVTLSSSTCTTDSNGNCSVTVTSTTNAGSTSISAADGSATSNSATVTEDALSIALTLTPSSIVADGHSTTAATATVKDASNNNPLSGESVSFAVSGAAPATLVTSSCSTDGNGNCTVQVRSSTQPGSTNVDAAVAAVSAPTQVLNQTTPFVAVSLTPTSIPADGHTQTSAQATVTSDGTNPLQGETVSFTTSGDAVTPTTGSCVTNSSGVCHVPFTSSTTIGSTTITATVGAGSGQATLAQTAGPAAHITALVLTPSTILADGQSTTSATATVTDAQGHLLLSETGVGFKSSDKGQSIIGPPTNNGDGTYTVQVRSSRTVGSSTITATDGSATPAQATLIQAAGPSTTSLFASTSSPVTNQQLTLVAQVNGGSGAPSGTITFENSGVAIAGCSGEPVSPSSTVATCQISFGAAGSPLSLSAVFVPGTGSTAPGSTGSLALDVKPDSTSVGVSGPAPALAKRRITYIAVVSPPSSRPGPIEPTGTVRFFDNGKSIAGCAARPLVNSTSTCAVVYARAGTHSITASYSGDANFTGSTSFASRTAVVTATTPIRGHLDPTMQWTFRFRQSYTTVLQMIVNGTSAGDIVTVTCHGHGCPFTKRVSKVKAPSRCGRRAHKHRCTAPRRVDITRALESYHLRAGVTIMVTITRPNWVGKSYIFRMRANHGPRIGIGCLAPGSTKPGVGCTT